MWLGAHHKLDRALILLNACTCMRINLLQDLLLLSKRPAKGLLKYILIVAEVHHLELFKDLFEI